ncbi:hypothetical protein TI05_08040 [Achromatium sp. WMS3]|nr:hypothetical protein TI05_08040 [Achromatium sp. WMS3]
MQNIHKNILGLSLLFISALGLLGIGITEHTGVTGKDEYYLGLRIPMCMYEQQAWLIPCLDAKPRLRKPPMLYWLTWANFKIFGPSLGAARWIAVLLAAILVLAVATMALELGAELKQALTAGLILLSCLGFAVTGRMLELDVPVATWSTLAFLSLLYWYKHNQAWGLILAALSIVAGFLTKGPVVFVVCGAGGLALLINDPLALGFLKQRKLQILGTLILTISLILPWFTYIYVQYPEVSAILASELQARRFFTISLVPLSGILLLTMPWGFVLVQRIMTLHKFPTSHTVTYLKMQALWIGLTLLPFFWFRTFERYLIGSLVPAALLLAAPIQNISISWRWTARSGFILAFIAALLFQIAALLISGFSFQLALSLLISLGFFWYWWQANNVFYMALTAALLWAAILGLVYPRIGVNAIPQALINQVRGHEIVLYAGPQPALLPAVLGRSLVHTDSSLQLPERLLKPCSNFLMLTPDSQSNSAVTGLQDLGFGIQKRGSFGILSSRVTWANMLRPGTTILDLWDAVLHGNLAIVKPQVILYQVKNLQCPTP